MGLHGRDCGGHSCGENSVIMGTWQKDLWEVASWQAWQGTQGRLAIAQSRSDKGALVCWMLVQVRSTHGSKPVLLDQGHLCPSGDTGHCLETV